MTPRTKPKLEPREDRLPAVTPQLALRVAIVGGVAFTLFAIVFFRLWFLQVLSGDQFLATANDNRIRDIRIQAPRGNIVDRNGNVLVDNRQSIAVQIEPEKLPPPGVARNDLYKRLGKVVGMSPKRIRSEIKDQRKVLPYSNVTLKADVPQVVYQYLFERAEQFTEQGVTVQRIFVRRYPKRTLAAQLFGTVGEIGPTQLKEQKFRGVKQGTVVGQGGIEYTYDRYLRGRDGAQRIYVDALGKAKARGPELEPEPGRQLRLSISSELQEAGEEAMQQAGVPTTLQFGEGRRGAFVALDPSNGEVLAMGSYPSFDPNIFAKPVTESTFKKLNSNEYGAPLYNRAIAGLYPTGSTFKLITGTAALESGLITPSTIINDGGSITVGGVTFRNARDAVNGPVNVSDALKVSSDVFFYTMGLQANGEGGDIIQTWAKRLGLGRRTGIDLPGEFKGLVPTPAQVDRAYRKKQFPYDKPWTVGDNINLSVGQGYLQATPLQMAVAYATVANGGKVVRPHVGLRVEDNAGRTLQQIEPDPSRRIKLSPSTRETMLEGLRRAAMEPGGTSSDVFKGFGEPIYGKTGTAERPGQADQSWYVAYVPNEARPIVLAVTVEQGGFGAEAAAPVARYMLSQWFGKKPKFVAGESQTR